MGPGILVFLILLFGLARELMPFSLVSQAETLEPYLRGALLGPVLDVLAFVAVALFAWQHLGRFRVIRAALTVGALVAGVVGAGLEALPIVQDLQHPVFLQRVVIRKLGEGRLEVKQAPADTATESLYVPNDEQYRRVPLGIPVEFRVAPRCEVAFVQGVLE